VSKVTLNTYLFIQYLKKGKHKKHKNVPSAIFCIHKYIAPAITVFGGSASPSPYS